MLSIVEDYLLSVFLLATAKIELSEIIQNRLNKIFAIILRIGAMKIPNLAVRKTEAALRRIIPSSILFLIQKKKIKKIANIMKNNIPIITSLEAINNIPIPNGTNKERIIRPYTMIFGISFTIRIYK